MVCFNCKSWPKRTIDPRRGGDRIASRWLAWNRIQLRIIAQPGTARKCWVGLDSTQKVESYGGLGRRSLAS